MMHEVRRASERGQANHGWLKSQHTFSFANYHDPDFMGFSALRVINEDRVAAGGGFGTHPHRDMEIISYVVSGALEHKDSMGNGSVIRPGDVQLMSAGTGVTHSEYNHSQQEEVKFLQIWIIPDRRGQEPRYEQHFFGEDRKDRLRLVASPDGSEGSLTIFQDTRLFASTPSAGTSLHFEPSEGRYIWLQVVEGELEVNGEHLSAGDGFAAAEEALKIQSKTEGNFLLFDLPGQAES